MFIYNILTYLLLNYKNVNMSVKIKLLSVGAAFFIGQGVYAQKDTAASVRNIEEVVVVGYGTQNKKAVTSSVTTVKGDAIADLNTASFESQLAGRATGVQVVSNSGLIGNAPVVRIRGVNSISSGTNPLYIVDGMPVVSGDTGGGYAGANALGDINPDDIESMTVLKDGAATAIYGSRAANGVILITTKKGKNGRFSVNYNTQYSVASVSKKFDLLNTADFLTITAEKTAPLNTTWAKGDEYDTDWQDAVLRTATQQDHFLSLTGGLGKGNYYASLGYTWQEGIIKPNSMQRFTMRMNADQKVTDWFKISANMSYAETDYNGLNNGINSISGAMFSALRQLPNTPIYDPSTPTGYNIFTAGTVSRVGQWQNLIPITSNLTNIGYIVNNNSYTSDLTRFLGGISGEVKLTKWLDYKLQASMDKSVTTGLLYWNKVHGDGFSYQGYIENNYLALDRWNLQNILNFQQKFDKHDVGLMLINEYQKQTSRYFAGGGTGVSDDFFGGGLISGSYSNQSSGGSRSENGIISYAAKFNYSFDSRYFIEASIRRDGLSALPTANKWGTFPGASIGWTVSNESFLKDNTVISDLKLRASYGKVGNSDIGNYPYLGLYSNFKYGDTNGIGFGQAGNDQLQWETNVKYNYGGDFGFFNNRLTLSADYFINRNNNLILAKPVSPSLGVPGNSINQNIGSMENKGFELSINGDIIKKEDFSWTLGGNFTTMKNEVLSLVNNQDIFPTINNQSSYLIRVGESLRSLYGFRYWGVNKANGNPVYYKADGSLVQGNVATSTYRAFDPSNPGVLGAASTLAEADKTILGSSLPKYFGAINTNLRYKNFDFSAMARFSGGNKIFNVTRREQLSMDFYNNGSEILGRWQNADNPGDGVTPRVWGSKDSFINLVGQASTRFVENGDFVKIDNITLGYSFDKELISTIKLTKLRVYVLAQNAFIITKYKGMDPELESWGMDYNSVPRQRTFSMGINATF